MAASASSIALSIDAQVEDIKASQLRAETLSTRLTSEEHDGFIAAYAYDHAEEELEWLAVELEETAARLRSLKRYTATGASRQGVTV